MKDNSFNEIGQYWRKLADLNKISNNKMNQLYNKFMLTKEFKEWENKDKMDIIFSEEMFDKFMKFYKREMGKELIVEDPRYKDLADAIPAPRYMMEKNLLEVIDYLEDEYGYEFKEIKPETYEYDDGIVSVFKGRIILIDLNGEVVGWFNNENELIAEIIDRKIEKPAQLDSEDKKYYVYLHSPYGVERIGSAETLEKAKEIKAKKDKDWQPGYMWHTTIETKELEEYSMWDSKVKDINPHKGESKEDFISRFMKETEKEYPDQKQRLAVAYSYWNRAKKVKDSELKTYICIGIPDEENIYHRSHTKREYWECQANSQEEAEQKAFDHFPYFHEVMVYEKEIKDSVLDKYYVKYGETYFLKTTKSGELWLTEDKSAAQLVSLPEAKHIQRILGKDAEILPAVEVLESALNNSVKDSNENWSEEDWNNAFKLYHDYLKEINNVSNKNELKNIKYKLEKDHDNNKLTNEQYDYLIKKLSSGLDERSHYGLDSKLDAHHECLVYKNMIVSAWVLISPKTWESPAEYDLEEINIGDYKYYPDLDEATEYMQRFGHSYDEISEDFENYFDKYYDKLLNHFRFAAEKEAQKDFDEGQFNEMLELDEEPERERE